MGGIRGVGNMGVFGMGKGGTWGVWGERLGVEWVGGLGVGVGVGEGSWGLGGIEGSGGGRERRDFFATKKCRCEDFFGGH